MAIPLGEAAILMLKMALKGSFSRPQAPLGFLGANHDVAGDGGLAVIISWIPKPFDKDK